jgi:PAS domain S-box-containing protein
MNALHLLVEHDRNRELLADWLSNTYSVTAEGGDVTDDDLAATDLCLVDEAGFVRHEAALREWKESVDPVFAPVVLITQQDPSEQLDPAEWETIDGLYVIDELVSVPVEKAVLYRRLENLLERRDLSMQLATQYERSEARFDSLFHATPDPAFVVVDGDVSYVNDAFCTLCGFDRDDVVGTDLDALDCFGPAGHDRLDSQFDALDAGERAETETFPLDAADGGTRYVEANARALTYGGERGVAVVLRDVTERRERERDLERTERRFREIAEHVNEVIWMTDATGETLHYMSPSYEDLTGRSPDHLGDDAFASFLDVMHPDDRAAAAEDIGEMFADGRADDADDEYAFAYRIENPDGEVRWIEGTGYPIRDADGRVRRFVGILDDVTGLKERERRFRGVFDQAYQFSGLLDPDGTVVAVNETLVEATGLDRDALVGEHITSAPWWDDETIDAVEGAVSAAAAGNVARSQERIETPDGDTVTIDFSVKPVVDDAGDIDLLVAEGRDITNLKERERELERQNERLEEFAGIVSHDLRNPLQVLVGTVASLRDRDDVDHVSDELDSMSRATDRMETLIVDLLELARAGEAAADPEPVALGDVAERAWGMVSASAGELVVDVDGVVVADASRLVQLFENLVRNSVDHTDGPVTVTVGRLDDGFYVADDGPGIPAEERTAVFEAGYTTSDDGSGLGLDIVSEVASAHGWSVAVTQANDGGARFEIRGVDFE